MRDSVMGSGVVHVLLLAVLFVVRTPMSLVVPGPDVVQVSLVDPSATIAPVKPPEPEPVVEQPEPIKPVEDKGVKLEPEKPKPKTKEKRPDEPRPRAATTTAVPSARIGTAGLQGDVAVDDANFEFTYYLILIRNKIASNWTPPAGISTGGAVRAVVYFRIGRSGELSGIQLETASGVEFFDRSAERAVTISDPLPPLPLGFSGGQLGVHFGFEWESP